MAERPLIVHVFDGFRFGGTEVRTCQIINALQDYYKHIVISCNGDFSASALIDSGTEVDYFHPDFCGTNSKLKMFKQIAAWLRKLSPHLLVAYEWGAIDWVMVNSVVKVCPTIMTIEGFEDAELTRQKWLRWLVRRLLYPHHCAYVVACSKVLCGLARLSWKVGKDKLVYIPNGINCETFQPIKNERGAKDRPVTLGIVASLIKLKNHQRLLTCMAEVVAKVDLRLLVVGDGPERKNLENKSKELGLAGCISFTGQLQTPWHAFQQFDIFCLTSDTEQMPMVVLEAMASGLPVLSTDVGDVRDMVADENKPFVVDKHDLFALSNALLKLCYDESLRRSIGQANLRRCRNLYDQRIMFNRYHELYQRTINDQRLGN